ncbi:GroES-like protein [Cryphonectria parasitica EP155]|uniref:GroES-like protein n=1 Tax=Cryphonectria parasitica (strain ATCC 38755 / EP155) TaxID=660469 RepID=A0A9P4Y0P8_CRYP1|nr:GroES-like protein [Cryphonectria parasitica EP155]KAF3764369.1 GroES-like protein [Cryphonectria parasitica EP155]
MKALVLITADKTAVVKNVPVPVLAANEILVKVHAVALNPVDAAWVMSPIAAQAERIVGIDFAGEVVEVPESLRGSSSDPRLKVGARVAGFVQGACSTNDRLGAFAEYTHPEWDLVWLIPDSMSYEGASTITACGLTAAQCLSYHLGVPSPFWPSTSSAAGDGPLTIFLYGASTSLGLFAAQLAHLAASTSGRAVKLVGTASKARHEMLKKAPYSYDALVDYHEADWPEQVRQLTGGGGVDFAVDCVTEPETIIKTESVLKRTGQFVIVRNPSMIGFSMDDVEIKPICNSVFECLGHALYFGSLEFPANPDARKFAAQVYSYWTREALAGKTPIEPNPVRLMPGGLERIVPDAFPLLSSGVMASSFPDGKSKQGGEGTEEHLKPIAGEKLVYTIT